MEKEILEKNKEYLKKLYFVWLEYFEVWNLSDYQEDDLIAFIEDLEKHNDFDEEIKMMKMYLRLAKRDQTMARDLKKVKNKQMIFDEIEIDFLNEVLDFYKVELEKRELSQLKKVSHKGMTDILKNKIKKNDWTGEDWL